MLNDIKVYNSKKIHKQVEWCNTNNNFNRHFREANLNDFFAVLAKIHLAEHSLMNEKSAKIYPREII